jgi:acetyl-CoA carboxylase carboxyltransferase component
MNVEDRIRAMQDYKQSIRQGGGAQAVDAQHDRGKLTARERIERLVDGQSFVEVDGFAQNQSLDFGVNEISAPGDGVVAGYAAIDGRPVAVYAQDFTVFDGSVGRMHASKIVKIIDMAVKTGCPVIGLIDSGGARIQEGLDTLDGYGAVYAAQSRASGMVPQVSVVMGPCMGAAAYMTALSDLVMMVAGSEMYITPPQVTQGITGEELDGAALGGADVQMEKSGTVDLVYESEEQCLDELAGLFGYLPQNNKDAAAIEDRGDDPNRTAEGIANLLPADDGVPYDVREIITAVVDNGAFLELKEGFAKNIVTGLARLGGLGAGIVANQPAHLEGTLDIDAVNKAARFVRFCDAFGIPVVSMVDVASFKPGADQEHGGLVRHGAKLLYAYAQASVPVVTVILRKAYGGAYTAMGSKHIGADMVYAWPTAQIAVMSPSAAANILFREEIASSADPTAARQARIEEYAKVYANPYVAAGKGYVDDVIEPEATRPCLVSALSMLLSKKADTPDRRHGNMPL